MLLIKLLIISMQGIKEIISILLFIVLISCSESSVLNEIDYMNYIIDEDNGLNNSKEINELEFQLQYEPINYKILKKIKDRVFTNDQYKNELEKFEGSQYFLFKIRLKDKNADLLKYQSSGQIEYANRVQYFSYNIQDNFLLVEGSDSLKCKLFHFERNFGISPYATFLLGFDSNDELTESEYSFKENVKEDKTLVYNDVVFGVGPIKYNIKAKDINNIPELTINYDVK